MSSNDRIKEDQLRNFVKNRLDTLSQCIVERFNDNTLDKLYLREIKLLNEKLDTVFTDSKGLYQMFVDKRTRDEQRRIDMWRSIDNVYPPQNNLSDNTNGAKQH